MIVITREVVRNGLAYVTDVVAGDSIAEALATARDAGATEVRLGVAPGVEVDTSGFAPAYDTLVMSFARGRNPAPCDKISLYAVDDATAEAYRQTLNAAFADVPNGSTESPEDIARQRAAPGARLYLGEALGQPAIAVQLLVNDDFVIDAIGVVPSARGHGLGRRLVRTLLAMARDEDKRVVLSVMTANEPALRLYESEGFVRERVSKHWYRRVL